MMILTILDNVSDVVRHGAGIAERDPHGLIISVVSITIVFLSLIVLYLAYELIGFIVNRWFVKKKDGHFLVEDNMKTSGNDVHDMESYAITINRKNPVQKTVDRGTRINAQAVTEDDISQQQYRTVVSSDGKIRSPLPGTIIRINVKEGDKVETGEPVAVLEAMKMENTIEAERSGTITKIHVSQGDSILEGGEILTIE